MDKIEAIRNLMDRGYARDVLKLVEGESPYTSGASEGVPQERRLRTLWVIAVHHLRFVAEFGRQSRTIKEGKFLTPSPKEFEQWLQAGAPGIADEDVQACLKGVQQNKMEDC